MHAILTVACGRTVVFLTFKVSQDGDEVRGSSSVELGGTGVLEIGITCRDREGAVLEMHE